MSPFGQAETQRPQPLHFSGLINGGEFFPMMRTGSSELVLEGEFQLLPCAALDPRAGIISRAGGNEHGCRLFA
jgi:hypothetical protein